MYLPHKQPVKYSLHSTKRWTVTRIKVDSNKVICPDFGRNVFYGFRNNYYELPLVDTAMELMSHHLQYMSCNCFVLIHLELIIWLIGSACTRLLLTNHNFLLWKVFEALSDIHVIIDTITCEELPPFREITCLLQLLYIEHTYLYLWYQLLLSHREVIIICDWILYDPYQNNYHCN